jgi:hypothetical protein
VPTQHDVRIEGKSFIVRIAPHTGGQVSGTVLTFNNVTAFRSSIDQAIYEREYAKTILNTVPDPLVVLSAELSVLTANRAFYSLLRASREAIQGVPLNALNNGTLDFLRLATQLKDMLAEDGPGFQAFEVDCDWPKIGRRTMCLYACPLVLAGHSGRMALLSFHDVTELKLAEEAQRLLAQEVDHRSTNLLALVQATVHFSTADTPAGIKAAIEGRIQALSNAHTLLSKSRWAGADLRTLVATGATARTRRAITASTAGALSLLGAVSSIAAAYLALIAAYHADLGRLAPVPIDDLLVIALGLPLLAAAIGWLLAGREPAVVSRQALE